MNKKISDLGEDYLLEWLARTFPQAEGSLLHGVGDDAAVLEVHWARHLLATTDSHVEGVHFRRDWLSFRELGRRAMVQNLSDIAAMGGTPTAALVALIAPPSLLWEEFRELALGIKEASEKYGAPVAGGNLSRGDQLAITITILGEVPKGKYFLREGAKEGDTIWITGYLGESKAGVMALEKKINHSVQERYRNPVPRIEESLFLAENAEITSLMDLSDGLYKDLPRLIKKLGARIYVSKIPLSSSLKEFCQSQNLLALETAILGGEDFELLFTSNDFHLEELKTEFEEKFKIPLTPIGKVIQERAIHWIGPSGQNWQIRKAGFEHF